MEPPPPSPPPPAPPPLPPPWLPPDEETATVPGTNFQAVNDLMTWIIMYPEVFVPDNGSKAGLQQSLFGEEEPTTDVWVLVTQATSEENTGSLTGIVEESSDGMSWTGLTAFAAVTGKGFETKLVQASKRFVRYRGVCNSNFKVICTITRNPAGTATLPAAFPLCHPKNFACTQVEEIYTNEWPQDPVCLRDLFNGNNPNIPYVIIASIKDVGGPTPPNNALSIRHQTSLECTNWGSFGILGPYNANTNYIKAIYSTNDLFVRIRPEILPCLIQTGNQFSLGAILFALQRPAP